MPNVKRPHLHTLFRHFQLHLRFLCNTTPTIMDSYSPHTLLPYGSIVFSTVGRTNYGFDIFSIKSPFIFFNCSAMEEHRLTDGASVNYNGRFVDEDETLVFVSERSGAPAVYLQRRSSKLDIQKLPVPVDSLFVDRPFVTNGRVYYISAHEVSPKIFNSSAGLYAADMNDGNESTEIEIIRVTPYGCVDYSPAISQSGELIAVASYGERSWDVREFNELTTDVVVFTESEPDKRTVVCRHGGWPSWSGDSTIYFHRRADDGWWSIYRVDLPEDLFDLRAENPARVTPPGVHCFTPAASHRSKEMIAMATRRPGKRYRHIEIFDVESQKFHPVTELLNPNIHHYNPFFSPEGKFLGYHRFRGEELSSGDATIPYLNPVISPEKELRMLRLNGSFASFSPSGDFIAFNHDFNANSGLEIIKSDGSKKWTLFRGRTAFGNSWSPAEPDVIFTSVGPVFDSVKATVQIARVTFNSSNLTKNDCREIPAEIEILTKEETGNNAFPSCSPDGKHVVFRSGRSGHKNLYIVDAVKGELEGGEIRQLTEGPWIDTMPSWSPDGKLIAFSSNRHNPGNVDCFSIYVIHPNGTGLRRIHVAGPEGSDEVDKERLNHVSFSKDCEWLLFAGNLGGVTAEPVSLPNQYQPYGDLYLVKLDGSGLRRLTWNAYENGTPAWHPSTIPNIEENVLAAAIKLKGQFDDVLWMNC
ncbi:hypothetical protein BC332_14490 [Capsicum chinense]|nr:hypothetical protein BC332_14490 [Capsicum chinense]